MSEQPKTNRGGARAGAGRPPRAQPRIAISPKIEPSTYSDLRFCMKAHGDISQADALAKALERERKALTRKRPTPSN